MASIDTIILKIHKITSVHHQLASVIQKKKKLYAQEILKTKIEDKQYEQILKAGQKKGFETNQKEGRLRMQKEIRKTIADIHNDKIDVSNNVYDENKFKSVLTPNEVEMVRNSDDIKGTLLHFLNEKDLGEEEIFKTFLDVLREEDKKKEIVTIRKYYKDNKVKIVPNSIFGKVGSNSYHYDIRFKLDWTNDFLELEFSIPKALYGTNVFQNIYHKQNGIFSKTDKISSIEWQADFMIKNLNTQLTEIFWSYFHIKFNDLDKKEIELTRIDICYNQVFKSKETCLSYLSQQKTLKRKWERDDHFTPRATSVSWTSKGSNFKIYHKGTEFEKHDKKQLYKVNSRRRKEKLPTINIDKIQKLADKTLRYELTYRAKRLSDLYKRRLHLQVNVTKTCPVGMDANFYHENWQKQELKNELFLKLKTDVNRWRYLFEKHGGGKDKHEIENGQIKKESIYEIRLAKKVKVGQKPVFKKSWLEYQKLRSNDFERNRLTSWSKWFDNVSKCFLDNNSFCEKFNGENYEKRHEFTKYTYNSDEMFDRFVLVPSFWRLLVRDFFEVVNQFALKTMEDETEFISRVETKNLQIQKNLNIDKEREKRKLSPLKRQYHEIHKYNVGTMKLLHFLVKEKSFKEIESQKMFPSSTWKRHKARLKELGITAQCVSFNHEKPRFDHYHYHEFLHHTPHLLKPQLKGFKYLKS